MNQVQPAALVKLEPLGEMVKLVQLGGQEILVLPAQEVQMEVQVQLVVRV